MLKRPNSTVEIRNINHKFKLSLNNNGNNFFNQNNNNICQSPKIYSGKIRYILENKKLFSLIDLNEKITNSKGPSLPIQFKRLTSKQINDLLKGNSSNNKENLKKIKCSLLKKNLFKRLKIPKEIKNDIDILNNELISKNIKSENNAFDENKKETENNIEKFISNTEQGLKNKNTDKKDEMMKRPNTSRFSYESSKNKLMKKKYDNFENNKDNNNIKKDIWMPTNYKNYEQMVKDRKLFIEKLNQNPFFNRLPSCTLKEIQSKIELIQTEIKWN